MAPLALLPGGSVRITPSTIGSRAATTVGHSASVGQPVAAPQRKPTAVLALGARERTRGRRASLAAQPVPLLVLERPEPDESNSSLCLADVPGLSLWPPTVDDACATSASTHGDGADALPLEEQQEDNGTSAAASDEIAETAAKHQHEEPEHASEHEAPAAVDQNHEQQEPSIPIPIAADGHFAHTTELPDASAGQVQQQQQPLPHPPTALSEALVVRGDTHAHHHQDRYVEQQHEQYDMFYPPHHGAYEHTHAFHHHQQSPHHQQAVGEMPASYTPSYAPSSAGGTSYALHKDQNSVTIKADTKVKDAAGAIAKVLDRLCSTLVTALQHNPNSSAVTNHHNHHHHHGPTGYAQHDASGGAALAQHEALNRAVKALAVCRKYVTDAAAPGSGVELGFFPVNRSDAWGRVDPSLFSFLAFKSVVQPGVGAIMHHQPEQHQQAEHAEDAAVAASGQQRVELHVSSNSEPATVASNLVRLVLDAGQAVVKAGGGNALFVAMTAVVQARTFLKAWHAMDILLVPQWITEDTRATLGRESKFLQFNVLPSGLHGVLPASQHAWHWPAIVPIQPTSPASQSGSSSGGPASSGAETCITPSSASLAYC